MTTLVLVYITTNEKITFERNNKLFISADKIIKKAEENGIQVIGSQENLELFFFNQQQMYSFVRYIADEIL